ncbi:MAG: DnaJ C-terminal domain-containing protein [Anaerolineae bacterium]
MEYRDYYQTLGVGKDASEKDIKRAFRKLAREYHPDVNPDDARAEEQFKEINEAYEALSDPDKRAKYDQLGSAWRDWDRRGSQSGNFDWSQWTTGAPGGQRVRYTTTEDLGDLFGGGNPFSDFFSQILSGMGTGFSPAGGGKQGGAGFQYRVRPQRGQDYEQKVEISLREAYQGTARALQKDERRLEVKIPPGAHTGTRVRIAGEGGPGATAGDLYLRVNVLPDPQFERRDDDLYVTVPVDLYTAILGGQAQVPTLSGLVNLTIPAGTQNERTFRLRGKGMPRLRQSDQYGDMYAKVNVQLPTQLGAHQRKLFEELQRAS